MARALIENLTEPWNPEQFKDGYREALLEIVEKKVAGEPIEAPEEAAPARVVDLMAALKASVDAAKKKTPSSSGGAKRSTAKTSAAKKRTTAKPSAKPAAKKTTAARRKAG
jgi:DNA end-binding protein Ku